MYRFVKRGIDFVLALLACVILSPIFVIIGCLIKLDSKGPVFFKQQRVGKDKRLFFMYKFRTMRVDAPKDTPTHLLQNSESYITRIGNFLRKTSLDELPQIFHIVTGKMAIIGPRPALYNQYDLIEERDKYGANALRPGLTGLAQVKGRDELPIEVKAAYDGEYVRKISFFSDLKIFFITIVKVLHSDGIVEGKQE